MSPRALRYRNGRRPQGAKVTGLYFEEFSVGQRFAHAIRRTVTEADNVFFSALTHNPAPLHLDEEYCRIRPNSDSAWSTAASRSA